MLDWIAAALGTKKGIAIAGLIGALLAGLLGPKRSWKEYAATFLVGFFSAIYLTSPLLKASGADVGDYEGGIGFLLGCFAMALADKALSLLKEINLETLRGIFGKGK